MLTLCGANRTSWRTIFTQHGGEYSLSGGVVSTELGVELPVPSVAEEIIFAAEETSGFIWRALKVPEVGL
ncbi:hypothetical protein LX90_006453 [Lentzea flava]|nr:hypothetical protein [Lentzea flava]